MDTGRRSIQASAAWHETGLSATMLAALGNLGREVSRSGGFREVSVVQHSRATRIGSTWSQRISRWIGYRRSPSCRRASVLAGTTSEPSPLLFDVVGPAQDAPRD